LITRVPTGVKRLDEVLEGGFPEGSMIFLAGNPGCGKTILSTQFLYSGLKTGRAGIYVSLTEGRHAFLDNAKGFGWEFSKFEKDGMFRLIDWVTATQSSMSALSEQILSTIAQIKAKLLVVDSVTSIIQSFEKPLDARIFLHTALSKVTRSMGITTIMVGEVSIGSSYLGLGTEEFVADGIVLLKHTEIGSKIRRCMTVLKMRSTNYSNEVREYFISKKNGIELGKLFKGYESILSGSARKVDRDKARRSSQR
jgi:circadian clock protein KaiC